MHPIPDYKTSAEFLVSQAIEIGLEYQVLELVKDKHLVVMKLPGSDPSIESILLNSHTDVVPVFEEFWKYPPFSAERVQIESGDFKIFARGAQDMKVTCSLYLEALRLIASSGIKLKRNVFAVFSPDEEIGGKDGMQKFVETKEFADMNVGQVTFTAHGNTGHGSQFIEGTAIEKLLPLINELMEKREQEKKKLLEIEENGLNYKIGEVTSINLTQLRGGKQPNVVPATYSVSFDIRVTPNEDLEEFREYLKKLAEKNNCDMTLLHPDEQRSITKIDKSNKFIAAFYETIESRDIDIIPIISPGATDARHVRTKGIPAFGFNPLRNHEYLAHAHNEYILESAFLYGIDVYFDMIQKLANAD
ncbi:Aminoacylase-1 [Smittium culicis]|uniref:Aminoacylase-1 n=1 Tax=Smittium culicis TaxID=133412 RepID=A0A1R1XYU3_9FUNG|nr:Aminoacylase-1 [Smittium culicis]